MNVENTKIIFEKYGSLFYDESDQLTLFNGYIEFDDGWFDLFNCFCDEILNYSKTKNRNIHIIQAKQKFGALRVYTDCNNDEFIWNLMFKYEKKSMLVCEQCGEPGEMRIVNGYYFTACEKHYKLYE